MAYEIYGPFHTKEDAVNTANVLGLKGFKNDHIFIFANESMGDDLKDRADAHLVNNYTVDHDDLSFINKMKDFFSSDSSSSTGMKEKLRSLGVTSRRIERYMSDIASGDILIVVKNQKRVGNDPSDSTIRLKMPIIKQD